MAKINTYGVRTEAAAPVQGRRASIEDTGNIGARIAQFGGALEQTGSVIEKSIEQSEISSLSAKLADAHARYSKGLTERLNGADPSDREVASKFLREIDDDMSSIGNEVQTRGARLYYEKASAQMRSHFDVSAAAAQAHLAGVQAKSDYLKGLNSFSSGVLNDPSSMEMTLGLHREGIEALVQSGALPREAAIQLSQQGERQIAKSAAAGMIKLNPDYAQQQLDSGKYDVYFDGDTKAQLYGEIQQAKRAELIDQERQLAAQKRLREEQQRQVQNDMLKEMSEGKLTARRILDSILEPTGSGSKKQFLDMLEQAKDERAKTDPATFNALFRRIHLPDGDPKKIVDENELNAWLGKGLKLSDVQDLRGEIQGRHTQEGRIESDLKKGLYDQAASALSKANPMLGIRDPHGEEQLQKFRIYAEQAYKEGRKAGKTTYQLLDPKSPDYIGKGISNFARSPQQIIRDMSNPVAPIPQPSATPDVPGGAAPPVPTPTTPGAAPTSSSKPARQPGESAAAYLKRVGK